MGVGAGEECNLGGHRRMDMEDSVMEVSVSIRASSSSKKLLSLLAAQKCNMFNHVCDSLLMLCLIYWTHVHLHVGLKPVVSAIPIIITFKSQLSHLGCVGALFLFLSPLSSEWVSEYMKNLEKKKLIPGIFQSFAVLTCWEELCLVGWHSASHFQDSHGEAWDETAAWTSESHQCLLLFSKLTPMTVLDLQAPAATLPLVLMPDLLHAAHLVLCLLAPSGWRPHTHIWEWITHPPRNKEEEGAKKQKNCNLLLVIRSWFGICKSAKRKTYKDWSVW